MSNQSGPETQQQALMTFGQTYEAFLAVFREVPDEALSFFPEGDEYTLGVLPLHLQDSLQNYAGLLKQMLATQFAQIDLGRDAKREENQASRHQFLVAQRPGAADRPAILHELATSHQEAHSRFASVDEATFERRAEVIYSAGTAPYPTSARDMLGWLADHYNEHIAQTQKMLAQWKDLQRSPD
ncbi:MAG TPA: DinB family protein [Ktedonobacterales bacterium]|nr:DinB family protein [Ktedonobacterales bacterium]